MKNTENAEQEAEVKNGELDVENGESNGSLTRVPQTSSLDNDVTPPSTPSDDKENLKPLRGYEALEPLDGEVKQCQPLGEDAVFQPLEGEEREL
ncbi:hypothetical protein Nepgr_033318 [Nepenthes gracilis]|uniref:Uncharacterized protein n=1 Tax=Nepenthes gracilis TaxID=150966 RepID=A0AAD3TK99_NEPGR|nr:hypothetical protein Nepgr_033318 [Nepenthes gracilis]